VTSGDQYKLRSFLQPDWSVEQHGALCSSNGCLCCAMQTVCRGTYGTFPLTSIYTAQLLVSHHSRIHSQIKPPYATQYSVFTSTYTTCFGPSWWPSSGVITIIYKGSHCSQRIRLVSVVNLHNTKLYVNKLR
jgi:hypothetical protein